MRIVHGGAVCYSGARAEVDQDKAMQRFHSKAMETRDNADMSLSTVKA